MMKHHILYIAFLTVVMAFLLSSGVVNAQDDETVIATVIRINGALEFREGADDTWEVAEVARDS